MGVVRAICISTKKGTPKQEVAAARLIAGYGIEGDAHAGSWHRQVSLLEGSSIDEFRSREGCAEIINGSFGENLVVEAVELAKLPVGARLRIGDVVLELTQHGKECHSHCAIYHAVGDCIMPREGAFAVVVSGGEIKAGDEIITIPPDPARPYTAARITLSDKGSRGEREDRSGPLIDNLLSEAGYEVVESLLLPDDEEQLTRELSRLADQREVSLIVTTGGTGFAATDRTPEATIAVCDRLAPGIAEAIRAYSMTITPRAMLSRAVSGIRKQSLIINLPGSPKAAMESLGYVLPVIEHGLELLRGRGGECAR